MVKGLSFRLQQSFDPFTVMPFGGSSEAGFLDIYLTKYFGVSNFGNTSAMWVTIFGKCSKFNLNFKTVEKKLRKTFFFLR